MFAMHQSGVTSFHSRRSESGEPGAERGWEEEDPTVTLASRSLWCRELVVHVHSSVSDLVQMSEVLVVVEV